MQLLSLSLHGQYKGLKDQTFDFSQTEGNIFALIGLNGSGKSQLLELIGEVFAYLERWQREDFTVRKGLGFGVTVFYRWTLQHDASTLPRQDNLYEDGSNCTEFRVIVDPGGDVAFSVRRNDDWLTPHDNQHIPIPQVVGYASGLNENLQRSFMKNAVQQFEVRRISAKRQKQLSGEVNEEQRAAINKYYVERYSHIFSPVSGAAFDQGGYLDVIEVNSPASKLIYLDYDNVGLLFLSLVILQPGAITDLLNEVAFRYPSKAILSYDFRSGVTEEDAIRDIQMLVRIAGEEKVQPTGQRTTDEQYEIYGLEYLSGNITFDLRDHSLLARMREANYNDPLALFMRLYRLQQLGVKNWSYATRQQLLKDDFFRTVKKPLKTKLPLTVIDLVLADKNGREVSFDDLSDGEAQLMQILAAARIFSRSQTLFLFDEPETHLNPSWRTYFHSHLIKALPQEDEGQCQSQVFLSTHSPFLISSLKREDIFFFKRDNNGWIAMEPAVNQTYGASFDILIKDYYGLRSLISQTVVEAVKKRLPKDNNPESAAEASRWIENNLGESMEKAYLLRKLQS